MLETHLLPPICAIVLSYAPLSYCRRATYFFIFFATINSSIGIVESIWKFRIFTFDPSWAVNQEPSFRASALIGHPLNNAMFTNIAIFVMLATPMPKLLRSGILAILLVSLVSFGGRIGLLYGVLGTLFYGSVTAHFASYIAGDSTCNKPSCCRLPSCWPRSPSLDASIYL